jgi:GT2 family glycosyltransferase
MPIMPTTDRPRVLLAITVYNGDEIVPRAMRSAARLRQDTVDIDVLMLDDASPQPGFSAGIAALADELGMGYYLTPRNLGIVRNVNLGLLRALEQGYDHVVISNSDVIYPTGLIESLVAVADTDDRIGSVVALSNNVSIYSLPNSDPDRFLSSQETVDELTGWLGEAFGLEAVDIPAGISFAMLITNKALHTVGVMDPIFGRGYCEETDWSRRCLGAGLRLVMAPSTFVYHAGQGSTAAVGMLKPGHSSVPEHEAILDLRYPDFRTDVGRYLESGDNDRMHDKALETVVVQGARRHGYAVTTSVLDAVDRADRAEVSLSSDADGKPVGRARFCGFETGLDLGSDPLSALVSLLGREPSAITLRTTQPVSAMVARCAEELGLPVDDQRRYPETV